MVTVVVVVVVVVCSALSLPLSAAINGTISRPAHRGCRVAVPAVVAVYISVKPPY